MAAPIVFFDLAGPDLTVLAGFYREVFGWDVSPDPRAPDHAAAIAGIPAASPLPGSFRREVQLADAQFAKVFYLGVEDVTAALALVEANGGRVQTPRFEVPGTVVLGLFRDPAGNLMGLVETEGGRPKVP